MFKVGDEVYLSDKLLERYGIPKNECAGWVVAGEGYKLKIENYAWSSVGGFIVGIFGKDEILMPTYLIEDIESEILEHLASAWNKFNSLVSTHPSDKDDFANAIHDLQKILAIRQVRRDYPKKWVTIVEK